jgi:hypothetical protein
VNLLLELTKDYELGDGDKDKFRQRAVRPARSREDDSCALPQPTLPAKNNPANGAEDG